MMNTKNITKETWYYKSGKIVDDYVYNYDKHNRLITEKSKNKYSERSSHYFYDKNSKTAKFKEYYSKWKDEPTEKYLNNTESFKPLFFTKFDSLTKTDSIFAITNDVWKKYNDSAYIRGKDSIYHKRLKGMKIYDNQYRVIEEKFFNYEDDLQNKKIYLREHLKYEYDSYDDVIKKTYFKDGKRYSYVMYGNGKTIKEEVVDEYQKSTYIIYNYTKDQKLERKVIYSDDKLWFDIKFEYKNNHITKLFYLDKSGQDDKKIEPTIIIFKYKFDKQKNWTEIIKNVDGKDLYKWSREIEYY